MCYEVWGGKIEDDCDQVECQECGYVALREDFADGCPVHEQIAERAGKR